MICKISEEIVFIMIEDEIVINTAWTMPERPFQRCLQQGYQDVCLQSRQHECEEKHHMEKKKGKECHCCRAVVLSYYFDVEKCKRFAHRDGCYKEGSKTKFYSVTLMSKIHSEQQEFQETEEFKTYAKER